ncbi:MAG: glycosyltransferase [Catalinimonas sp.]
MKLSIVIVNYNVSYFLEQTLLSVRRAVRDLDAEVFVVDNNSVDGSVTMVRKRFPEVHLIANQENVGFARANNQAIRRAGGEHVLLLNPDTVLEEDTLTKCCAFMDTHPDAGGLGVRMVDGTGRFLPESKRGLPTPEVAFYKVFGLAALFPRSRRFGRYHLGFLSEEETHTVDVLSGAFMMLRAEALEQVGLLDEDYFMYGEDIDLSYRITRGGYRNYYFPEARIIHYKGESTKRTSLNYVFVFYRAMLIFARKHFSPRYAAVYSLLIHAAIYLRAGMAVGHRLAKRALLPLLDTGTIFVGMYFLKSYWEDNHKHVPMPYPTEYMLLAVPAYILVWLLSAYFSGVYDRPYRVSSILRGSAVGTVLISAVSNFFDAFRFSKALIVLGGAWTVAALLLTRLALQWVRWGKPTLGDPATRRTVVVGNAEEGQRVWRLLQTANPQAEVLGYVTPNGTPPAGSDPAKLGEVRQLPEILEIYKVAEVIFCSKDLPVQEIIGWMTTLQVHAGQASDRRVPTYRIVPEDSNYVIGSSSKASQGDLYTVGVSLNIAQPTGRRNKRLFDLCSALLLLILAPVMAWGTRQPDGFIRNVLLVLVGRRSWVGFARPDQLNLPHVRPGVLSTAEAMGVQHDEATLRRLDYLYAKDYHPGLDLEIMLKSFRQLGGSQPGEPPQLV